MTVGFTGTQIGMRPRQLKAVRQLLYNVTVIHLGDCVGADAEAYHAAQRLGVKTIGHPPIDPSRRANLAYDEEREPFTYLKRNADIVNEGVDGLIATPSGWAEELRSGTWMTIRYARKRGRKIWIVRPDGSVVEEAGKAVNP